MIRATVDGGTWLFSQTTHAFMCGQMARLWDSVAPRDEMHFVAANHDAGWVPFDAAPTLNLDGQPRTFTEMDLDDHFQIWHSSIAYNRASNRYAGLLVSLHATSLYQRRLNNVDDRPEDQARIQAFIDEQLAQQAQWREALHHHYGAWATQDYLDNMRQILQAWDWISLVLCMGMPRPQHQIPMGTAAGLLTLTYNGLGTLQLEPWPFITENVTLTSEARWLPEQIYPDDATLQHAYQVAPLEVQQFTLISA